MQPSPRSLLIGLPSYLCLLACSSPALPTPPPESGITLGLDGADVVVTDTLNGVAIHFPRVPTIEKKSEDGEQLIIFSLRLEQCSLSFAVSRLHDHEVDRATAGVFNQAVLSSFKHPDSKNLTVANVTLLDQPALQLTQDTTIDEKPGKQRVWSVALPQRNAAYAIVISETDPSDHRGDAFVTSLTLAAK